MFAMSIRLFPGGMNAYSLSLPECDAESRCYAEARCSVLAKAKARILSSFARSEGPALLNGGRCRYGVSGSGKSSLAFGTLYAEAQRRYLDSVAPNARRLIHQVGVPEVDAIDGLPPAVALQQQRGTATTRSSVGSVTTVSNSLRMVEHDMRVVASSDWVIDIGPGAGEDGGHVVASGPPDQGRRTL
jgi:hypothetical protein